MGTPQYIKNAQNNYNAKFDLVQLKLPKGTKERIKSVLEDGQSISGYCVQSVLVALESDEEYLQNAVEEPENFQNAKGTTEPAGRAKSILHTTGLKNSKGSDLYHWAKAHIEPRQRLKFNPRI